MGDAAFEEDAPFLDQPLRAAAVICRTEHGNLHTGLLYRGAGGTAAVLHLGWQDYLCTSWSWSRMWAAPDVEPERLASVAGLCRRIWERFEKDRTFPYGLKYLQTTFRPSGQLVLSPGAKGLTCATFVLAVFNAVGVRLVDEEGWPVRPADDRLFLEAVRRFASPEHFAVLEREVEEGCKRVQPHEVVGACSCPLPATFDASHEAGERVVGKLNSRKPLRP